MLVTEILSPSDQNIRRVANLLSAGDAVALPTETVYGLGVDATNAAAIAKVYAIKNRPEFNPLIAHVRGAEQARQQVAWSETADRLAAKFWPGPLTLVLPTSPDCRVAELARAGLSTLAVRAPDHPVMRSVLAQVDFPIAAPSANLSGMISPTTADHVAKSLAGRIMMVLDGGPCAIGIESTIVDLSTAMPTILRAGAVTVAEIGDIVGRVASTPDATIKAPGMMSRHYAPSKPLILNVEKSEPNQFLLAFGATTATGGLNLSPSGDLVEAAANLYAMLRLADAAEAEEIAVMPIPMSGLGIAINDRLARAAAPN